MTRMAQAACSMSAADRDQRLPSPGTGDELDGLARSFNGLLERLHEALERQMSVHRRRLAPVADAPDGRARPDRGRTPPRPHRRRNTGAPSKTSTARPSGSSRSWTRCCSWRGPRRRPHGPISSGSSSPPGLETTSAAGRATSVPSISARISNSGEPAWVRVHPHLLGQLLDNLLENACKYSAPGTPIHVSLERDGDRIAMAVQDQGPGLPPEELPHIFEPFYRTAEARRLGQSGVGLGLAVVRRIADVLGGTIDVTSEPGRGSRFVLHLPIASRRRCRPRVHCQILGGIVADGGLSEAGFPA